MIDRILTPRRPRRKVLGQTSLTGPQAGLPVESRLGDEGGGEGIAAGNRAACVGAGSPRPYMKHLFVIIQPQMRFAT